MAVYPTILSGQRLTTTLLTAMLPAHAAKGSSTSRASTTSLTADPDLQLGVTANAEYLLEMYIRYSGDPAADLTCQITAPSGASGSWGGSILDSGETVQTGTKQSIRTPVNATRDIGCISTGTAMAFMAKGRIITAGTAGTLSFDWAQRVSNATGTVIESDSFIELRRIA